VLRKALAPVLIAKKPLTAGPKTVFIPTDFSACSRKAAEEALALVQHFGGRLVFFHAFHMPAYAAFSDRGKAREIRNSHRTRP
jgi:hypothetical protein